MSIPAKLKSRWSQEQESFLLITAHLREAFPRGTLRGDKELGLWSKRFGGKPKASPLRFTCCSLACALSHPFRGSPSPTAEDRRTKTRGAEMSAGTERAHQTPALLTRTEPRFSAGRRGGGTNTTRSALRWLWLQPREQGKAEIWEQINLEFVSPPHTGSRRQLGWAMLSAPSHVLSDLSSPGSTTTVYSWQADVSTKLHACVQENTWCFWALPRPGRGREEGKTKKHCLSSNVIRWTSGELVRNSRNNEYMRWEVVEFGFWFIYLF